MSKPAWLPIETAPKSGAKLIGFWKGVLKGPFIMWWNHADKAWEAMTNIGVEADTEPTHWMPLPPPPEDGKEKV